MREILFRGKKCDGKWGYGSLIQAGTYCCILESEENVHPMDYPYLDDDIGTFDGKATPVNPETVGQWTEMVDKNGTKIFEGDIIDVSSAEYIWFTRSNFVIVEWDDCYSGFDPFVEYVYDGDYKTYTRPNLCVVVGNIHDNPELIKK